MRARVVDPSLKVTKEFLINPLPRVELPDRIVPGVGRIYQTPAGDFKSVTTILKDVPDDKNPNWLIDWKMRLGEEEAARQSGRARSRGNQLHDIVERYLLSDPNFGDGAMPSTVANFRQVRKIIDEGVGTVYGVEIPLYSERLQTAGRSDLIAGYQGYNSVIDWKGSNNPKELHMVRNYCIQAACYAVMAEEMYPGLNIPRIVVVVMVEHQEPQVFVRETDEWREWVERVFARREFHG